MRRRPLPAHALAVAHRTHVARCSCGTRLACGTGPGLLVLADDHTRRLGLEGHRIHIPTAPKGTGTAGGLTVPTREAVPS